MAASQRASPPLCLPPYVSLDHPWCADWGVRLPIRTLSPLPYAAALPTVPTLREEEGGCTHFPKLGLRVRPERGSVLVWRNVDAQTLRPDRQTRHGSEPPRSSESEKWIVNFFYRQHSYFELAVAAMEGAAAARESEGAVDAIGVPLARHA